MDQANRKSYLAPPAPRAIKRDGSRDSVSHSNSAEKPQKPRFAPTGEIPLNIPQDPAQRSPAESRSAIEPSSQTMGFEQLSLSSHDRAANGHHSARSAGGRHSSQHHHRSAESSPQRHHHHTPHSAGGGRSAIPPGGLPIRAAPPPNGPLPTPPNSGEHGSWRGHSHRV